MEAVLVALIVALAGLIGPLLIARQLNRRQDALAARAAKLKAEERAADLKRADEEKVARERAASLLLARQDDAAEKVEEAGRLLLEAQAETMRRTDAVEEAAVARARASNDKLDELKSDVHVVHGLVNSQLSTALKNELDALEHGVLMMREVSKLNEAGGLPPTKQTVAAILKMDARILELQAQIADRELHDENVEQGKAEQGKAPVAVPVPTLRPEPA